MQIATIGLDIAKRVFQAHGADAAGKAVLRRKLQRTEVLAFLPPGRPAWSASKRAARPITGLAKSGRWATKCG